MADFSLKSIAPRLFNGSKYETNTARNSNPAGYNSANIAKTSNPFFTGAKVNVLTADVFDSAAKSAPSSASMISKAKRMCSTFVGSINDLGSKIKAGFESVAEFCGRIKSGISDFWATMNNTNVPSIMDAYRSIKSGWEISNYNKEVNKLAQSPVSDLKSALISELSLNAAA